MIFETELDDLPGGIETFATRPLMRLEYYYRALDMYEAYTLVSDVLKNLLEFEK